MIRWLHLSACATITAIVVLIAVPGCTTPVKKTDPTKAKTKTDDGHEHGEVGPHGGLIAEWPPYHGELTVDHTAKLAIVYILDETLKKAPDVDAKRFSKVKLTIADKKAPITIDFTHDAKKSGPEGIAYSATHDFFAKSAPFKGNLAAVLDDGEKKAKPLTDDVKYEPKKAGGEKK